AEHALHPELVGEDRARCEVGKHGRYFREPKPTSARAAAEAERDGLGVAVIGIFRVVIYFAAVRAHVEDTAAHCIADVATAGVAVAGVDPFRHVPLHIEDAGEVALTAGEARDRRKIAEAIGHVAFVGVAGMVGAARPTAGYKPLAQRRIEDIRTRDRATA